MTSTLVVSLHHTLARNFPITDIFAGFDSINKILNLANDVNSTVADVADISPVTAQTIGDIQNIVNPIANATSGVAITYGQLDQVLGYLNTADKIVAVVARDIPVLEE